MKADAFLNLIVGDNAQGKTNLLDAIYYLSHGTSYRYHQDQQLIRWNADFYYYSCDKNKYALNKLAYSYKDNKKYNY